MTEAVGGGRPIEVQIDVLWDQDAGVYVGSSEDIQGLVVEARDLASLLGRYAS